MRMHRKFAIFHGKNGQKCPFFGQKMSFSASDKQLKTPPSILREPDAKRYLIWTHRELKHNLQYAKLLKRVVFLMLQVLGFLDVIKSYVCYQKRFLVCCPFCLFLVYGFENLADFPQSKMKSTQR